MPHVYCPPAAASLLKIQAILNAAAERAVGWKTKSASALPSA